MDLEAFYKPVKQELEKIKAKLHNIYQKKDRFINRYLAYAGRYEGKLLRPALLLHSARLCGGIDKIHIELGVILELIHKVSLIHDDVIDEARVRRNKPTLNYKWGNRIAILLGDYIFSKVYHLSTSIKNQNALRLLSMATTSVCYGEMLQVATRFYFDMKPDMYFKIVKHKTSAMFSAACLLGAINNGAPEGLKKNLAGFGNNFGMAFQLVDDCADILGHSKIEGKSLGVDLQKGEFTFPIVMLLRYAKCAKFLQDLLKLDITIQERKRKIKVLINQHHLKPVILKYIKRFTNMALQRLGNLQIPGVKYLEHLTNYLNNRANTLLTNLK